MPRSRPSNRGSSAASSPSTAPSTSRLLMPLFPLIIAAADARLRPSFTPTGPTAASITRIHDGVASQQEDSLLLRWLSSSRTGHRDRGHRYGHHQRQRERRRSDLRGVHHPNYHPGGVNVLVGDGSVRFVKSTIDGMVSRLWEPSPAERLSRPTLIELFWQGKRSKWSGAQGVVRISGITHDRPHTATC